MELKGNEGGGRRDDGRLAPISLAGLTLTSQPACFDTTTASLDTQAGRESLEAFLPPDTLLIRGVWTSQSGPLTRATIAPHPTHIHHTALTAHSQTAAAPLCFSNFRPTPLSTGGPTD